MSDVSYNITIDLQTISVVGLQSVQCRRDYEDEVIELRRQLEVEVTDKVTHEKRLQDTREQVGVNQKL